jgi:hypothetical protein
MAQFINHIRPVALFLLLIVTGFYAGIHFASLMNPSLFGIINPAGDRMPAVQWAATWQVTDGFMRVRMGIFGPVIQITYLVTLLLFIRQWRSAVFWLVLAAFGLFMADVVLTITRQIPINRYIEHLDFRYLTPQQVARINDIHPQVIHNFEGRELLSLLGFALVSLTPFLQPPSRSKLH